MRKTLIALSFVIALSAFSGPNAPEASAVQKAYQAGFGNAALYWRDGVTITDPGDIKQTAEVRAYRQGYTKGAEREAFIKGWVEETMELLHNAKQN